jgi:hypothetical protein
MLSMATMLQRIATSFQGGVWIRPRIKKTETGTGGVNNQGARDMVRLTITASENQASDNVQITDYAQNVLAGVDAAGNIYQSGVTAAKECVAQVTLTAAQIIAMFTTPVSIVPAPAAGQAIIVEQILVELNLGATAFSGGGVVHFYYHGLTVEVMAQTLAAATIQGAAGQSVYLLEPAQTAGGSVVTKNLGVDITNATAVFAAGNGTAIVTVWYSLVTL